MDMSLTYWIQAIRPKTLSAGVAPILIGCTLAYNAHHFHLISALCALVASVSIQIGTNLANDYFDFKKGADTPDRIGPTRVTQAGLIPPETVKKAFILAFGIAVLAGLYLIFRGGWPIIAIGLASILSGVLYTGGPFPLGYIGLGDLFAGLFFGPVAVMGTYYVNTLSVSKLSLLFGLALGAYSVALISMNNLRDADEDSRTNKRTLVVLLGKTFGKIEYTVAMIVAVIIPLAVCGTFTVLVASTLIIGTLSAKPIHATWTQTGRQLNHVLANTGAILLIASILWSISLLAQ